jgi:hypothetical protein
MIDIKSAIGQSEQPARRHRIRRVIAALVLLTVACGDDGPTVLTAHDLARAEIQWHSKGFQGSHYIIRQQHVCFCGDHDVTYEVTVSGGQVSKVVIAATGAPLPAEQFPRFRSVEQLFAELRAGMQSGTVRDVRFDTEAGYPTLLSLDPFPQMADDEVIYLTSNLVRIP